MNEQFTPELLAQARTAETPEALLALAQEHGIPLTPEEAQTHFSQLHQNGALSDEELDNVAGGCGGGPQPKLQVGDRVARYGRFNDTLGCSEHYSPTGGDAGESAKVIAIHAGDEQSPFYYELACCVRLPSGPECGRPITVNFLTSKNAKAAEGALYSFNKF